MIGLVVLLAVGLWFSVGWLLWRRIIAPRVGRPSVRLPVGVALAGVWLLLPWADEVAGAHMFDRLCQEIPDTSFHGPVSVGPGTFFDGQGHRVLWAQSEIEQGKSSLPKDDLQLAYREGKKFLEAWTREFKSTQETRRIRTWPVPVVEQTTLYVHGGTGRTILVSYWRGSPGGWLKRITGWGNHAPYQCKSKGPWPHEFTWIKF